MIYKNIFRVRPGNSAADIFAKVIDLLFLLSIFVLTCSFTLSIAFNSIAIVAMIGLFLMDYRKLPGHINAYFASRRNLLLLAIFLSLLASVTYSENRQDIWYEILKYLPLISIPLALTKAEDVSPLNVKILVRLYIASCFIAALLCIVFAIIDGGLLTGSYKSFTAPENHTIYIIYRLSYHSLSEQMNLHAIYFTLFICVAIFMIVNELKGGNRTKKGLLAALLIFFLLYIILLKASVLNLALYTVLSVYVYIHYSFKKWYQWPLFLLLTAFAAFVVFYLFTIKNGEATQGIIYLFDDPQINHNLVLTIAATVSVAFCAAMIKILFYKNHIRILTILAGIAFLAAVIIAITKFNNHIAEHEKGLTNVNVRLRSWVADWKITREHPVLGVGLGDAEDALIQKYREMGFEGGVHYKFDAHSQYFQFWINSGILPVACFLLLLADLLYKAIRRKNFVLSGLVFCFASLCITESVMNAQAGRIFFLFFICIAGNSYFDNRNHIPLKQANS